MKMGCTDAEASGMMHINCGMLDHLTPFPMVPVQLAAVTPAMAIPVHVVAVVNPPVAGKTGNYDDLDLHCQFSDDSK